MSFRGPTPDSPERSPRKGLSKHGSTGSLQEREEFSKLKLEIDKIFTIAKQDVWRRLEQTVECANPEFLLPPAAIPPELPGFVEQSPKHDFTINENAIFQSAESAEVFESDRLRRRMAQLDDSLREDDDRPPQFRRRDRKLSTRSVGPLTDIVPQVRNGPRAVPDDALRSMDLPAQERHRRRRRKAEKNCVLISSERNYKMLADASLPERLTKSKCFRWTSSIMILLNCAFLGWTTEHMAQRAAENFSKGIDPDFAVPAFMIGLQVSFTAFFAIELQLHWWSEGFLGFLKSEDVGWHVLDILCVAVGVVDCILDLEERTHPGQHSVLSQFTVVRGIRVVRILRVVRASRVMQMCRELRMMVFSTVNCLKSVLWITIIFSVIFYMFAIVFTSGVVSYLDTVELRRSSEHSDLQTYFGSLSHSMLSLYMAMAGGNNWTVYYSALASMDNGGIYCSVFLLYITFMLFAVVNIVTGVFVDAAMQSSRADQSVVVQHELETKKHYLDSLKALYEAIDEDSSGMITREMLEASFQNESVLAYLSALKLNTPDASTLFDLLDFDQSDAIDIDEFLLGCYNLHGDASNIDVKLTHAEVRFVKETLLDLIEDVHEMKQQLPGNPSQPTSGLEPGNSEPLMPQTLNPKP